MSFSTAMSAAATAVVRQAPTRAANGARGRSGVTMPAMMNPAGPEPPPFAVSPADPERTAAGSVDSPAENDPDAAVPANGHPPNRRSEDLAAGMPPLLAWGS